MRSYATIRKKKGGGEKGKWFANKTSFQTYSNVNATADRWLPIEEEVGGEGKEGRK